MEALRIRTPGRYLLKRSMPDLRPETSSEATKTLYDNTSNNLSRTLTETPKEIPMTQSRQLVNLRMDWVDLRLVGCPSSKGPQLKLSKGLAW